MAYGNLCEGNRVWDSSKDLGIFFEDSNEIQDQLKGMLNEAYWSIGLAGIAETDWTQTAGNDPPRWEDTTDAGDKLIIPISLKAGMYITRMDLIIGGNAGSGTPDGSIKFIKWQVTTSSTISSVATYTPVGIKTWEQGGAGPIKITIDSINHTVLSGYEYALQLTSNSLGAGNECYYYGGVIKCQFGN